MEIERLNIWKLGVGLAKDVYILTERFPKIVALTVFLSFRNSEAFLISLQKSKIRSISAIMSFR